MLHALQHPCIVSLIGISIHPLCFALELAPLGSLNTVLSENAKGTSHAQNLPGGCRAGPPEPLGGPRALARLCSARGSRGWPGGPLGRAGLPEAHVAGSLHHGRCFTRVNPVQ